MTRRGARKITQTLMDYHEVDKNVYIEFFLAKDKLGHARFTNYPNPKPRCLGLNLLHIWFSPREEVINTIKHEIAHLKLPFEEWHGPEWKKLSLSIGCDGEQYSTCNPYKRVMNVVEYSVYGMLALDFIMILKIISDIQ